MPDDKPVTYADLTALMAKLDAMIPWAKYRGKVELYPSEFCRRSHFYAVDATPFALTFFPRPGLLGYVVGHPEDFETARALFSGPEADLAAFLWYHAMTLREKS